MVNDSGSNAETRLKYKQALLRRQVLRRLSEWTKAQKKAKKEENMSPRMIVPVIRPPDSYQGKKVHKYHYEPLATKTSIRCLVMSLLDGLTAGTRNEFDIYRPINCSLITIDLADSTNYDALSYTWGDPCTIYATPNDVSSPESWSAAAFDIQCDGKPLSVTSNLYAALLALRFRLSARADGHNELPIGYSPHKKYIDDIKFNVSPLIWIDQICIDQGNLAERNNQVLLMSRVYKQAQNVHVWLGGEDKFSRAALNTFVKLGFIKLDKARELVNFDITQSKEYSRIGMEPISIFEWCAIYTFLNRSWFQRAWIIQEAAFAKTLTFICGLLVTNFASMSHLIAFLNTSGWMDQMRRLADRYLDGELGPVLGVSLSRFRRADNVKLHRSQPQTVFNKSFFLQIADFRSDLGLTSNYIQVVGERRRPLPFWTLLARFRYCKATDPRDRIYALMGLSEASFIDDSEIQIKFAPDYTKPPREVYVECIRFLIRSSRSLECLSLKEHRVARADQDPQNHIQGLPSWVPDLTQYDSLPLNYGTWPWSAGDDLGSPSFDFLEQDRLSVRGLRIGTIKAVTRVEDHMNLGLDCYGLLDLLRLIPERSAIRTPKMTRKLRETLEQLDVPIWESFRQQVPQTIPDAGKVRYQDRFEVLWRTLLRDSFSGQHPAPTECAKGVMAQMELGLYILMTGAGLGSLRKQGWEKTQLDETFNAVGIHDWESAKLRVSQQYTAMKILDGNHPYESQELIFPPELGESMEKLELSWTNGSLDGVMSYLSAMESRINARKQGMNSVTREKIELYSRTRNLFAVAEGYLGTANTSSSVGDEIWILAGTSVPFVLRPTDDQQYRLISAAYVHGLMYGELSSVAKVDLQTIVIV
jgi:hypothetical protein